MGPLCWAVQAVNCISLLEVVLQAEHNIRETDLWPTCTFLQLTSLDHLEQLNRDMDMERGNDNLNKAYWALKKVFSEEIKKSPLKEEKRKAKEKRKNIPIWMKKSKE